MMRTLIQKYKLQPADRIVVPKSQWRVVQHHAIYLGKNALGVDLIAENNSDYGVRIITADNFFRTVGDITRIEKFKGTNHQRQESIKRAIKLVGTTYNLINFNCEHYSNLVQHKISKSDQVIGSAIVGLGILLLGGVLLSND